MRQLFSTTALVDFPEHGGVKAGQKGVCLLRGKLAAGLVDPGEAAGGGQEQGRVGDRKRTAGGQGPEPGRGADPQPARCRPGKPCLGWSWCGLAPPAVQRTDRSSPS